MSEVGQSTEDRANAILDAWLQFIQLEDFSSSQVNDIKSKDVTISNDNIVIGRQLFLELQKAHNVKKIGQAIPWVLSFPQIFTVEYGKKKFCPLFSLDVTAILTGNYQADGWNIDELELSEAGSNLVTFLGIEEDRAENMVTKDGLKDFLEAILDTPIISFEDWMNTVSISKYRGNREYQVDRQPYFFKQQGSNFSRHLKQDIRNIRNTRLGDRNWLRPGQPAYEYLFGRPKLEKYEISYLGAFPTKYSPAASQVKALKHAQTEPVTVVQGPPGSGKTTLILHLIAQQVVSRALSIIENKTDVNNLTVVSSTNGKAVENVIERLSKDLPECFFYLSGGSKDAVESRDGAVEQLRKAIAYLQENTYDRAFQGTLAQQIRQIKAKLTAQENQYLNIQQQLKLDESRCPQLVQRLQQLNERFTQIHTQKHQLEQQVSNLKHFENLPQNLYKRIQVHLSSAKMQLSDEVRSRWTSFFGKSEQQIIADVVDRCQDDIGDTIGTPFEISLPTSRVEIDRQLKRVEEGLFRLGELRDFQYRLHQLDQESGDIRREWGEKKKQLADAESRLKNVPESFYGTFHIFFHADHVQLFELCRQFLEQETLRNKDRVSAALHLYQGILPGEPTKAKTIRHMEDDLNRHLQSISLMFPVVTSTLLSVKNMVPWLTECIDRVIIDEAGMITIHQPFPLLVRSRKATIVGDPFQIQPIVNQGETTLVRYYTEFFENNAALTSEDVQRYSPDEIKTATTYHRAAGASGNNDDIGQGIRLLEHYRCHPDIISFCDDIIRYGLTPNTAREPSLVGPNLLAYHVEGKMNVKVNQEEIEAVKKVVEHLIDHGYSAQDIGVISAFRAQADKLREVLSAQSPGLDKDAIGTVHTFQGSERRVIVLSTKACRERDNIAWFDRSPNLLNVAVSRAKELFILVGNLHLLESKGTHTRKLVEHIRQHGVILEYKLPTQFSQEYTASESTDIIYDCDHLEVLEDALIKAKKLYIVVPKISGPAARQFINSAKSALERGVKITVKYGRARRSSGHSEDSQTQEEKALSSLFASHTGARLLQQTDEGTNERILVCDDKFAVVGSWNWLSHVYAAACQKQALTPEVQICKEISFYTCDPSSVQSIKESIIVPE